MALDKRLRDPKGLIFTREWYDHLREVLTAHDNDLQVGPGLLLTRPMPELAVLDIDPEALSPNPPTPPRPQPPYPPGPRPPGPYPPGPRPPSPPTPPYPFPVCLLLTPCDEAEDPVIVEALWPTTDVVLYDGLCYTWAWQLGCSDAPTVELTPVYGGCEDDACAETCYALTACVGDEVVHTKSDVSDDVGKVVLWEGECWTISGPVTCPDPDTTVPVSGYTVQDDCEDSDCPCLSDPAAEYAIKISGLTLCTCVDDGSISRKVVGTYDTDWICMQDTGDGFTFIPITTPSPWPSVESYANDSCTGSPSSTDSAVSVELLSHVSVGSQVSLGANGAAGHVFLVSDLGAFPAVGETVTVSNTFTTCQRAGSWDLGTGGTVQIHRIS